MMNDKTKAKLLAILRDHQGRENPITARRIAQLIGVDDTEGRPVTRSLIRKMIEREGWPVAANGRGYYWIKTRKELLEYYESLTGRIEGIKHRQRMVVGNYFEIEQREQEERRKVAYAH